jgi:hypothetical protein
MAERLLFEEAEWNAAVPKLVKEMTEYLKAYRAPVFEDLGTYGDGWGSGSYLHVRSVTAARVFRRSRVRSAELAAVGLGSALLCDRLVAQDGSACSVLRPAASGRRPRNSTPRPAGRTKGEKSGISR